MRIAEWIAEKRRSVAVTPLSACIPKRNYAGLNEQDEQLRLWVPDPVKRGLEEVSARANLSLTAYLIEFFATHLYGYHEVSRMREMKTGLYEPVQPKVKILAKGVTHSQFCEEEDYEEPDLGKNIFPLKLFVPAKLKADLSSLAVKAGITLGEYSRALISAHLFGQTYAPRPKAAKRHAHETRADKWERMPD